MNKLKKRVLLRAPLLTSSGYGVHSRQVFEFLYNRSDIELDVEVLNWGQTSWLVNPELENGLVGKIMSCARGVKPPYDYSFQVQLPDEWDTKLAKKNVGISAVVETDFCNPKWIEKCNDMDLVIVPSSFTKSVLERSGNLKKRVEVVPEWFNNEILSNKENDLKELANKKFNFYTPFNLMMIGQITGQDPWSDRKNIFFGIKWFFETFADRPDVGLILKTNSGKSTSIDKKLTTRIIKNVIKEARQGPFPKVHLIHGNLTSKEMASLYYHPKVYGFFSSTRGEGYGLPLVDAAASGLPVLTTNWSGHLEFLKEGLFSDVNYTLKSIPDNKVDNRIFMKGTRWAEVDELDFKTKLRNLFNSISENKEKALKLKEIVQEDFSKNSVCEKYEKVLKKNLKW